MYKKIITILVFSLMLTITKGQSILPLESAEFCPSTEYTFEVHLPGACTNINVFGIAQNVAPQVTVLPYNIVPASNQTIFYFKGKFVDYNDKQTFNIQYNNSAGTPSTYPAKFSKIKSLLTPNSSNNIFPTSGSITSARCQITTHNISFQNSHYGNLSDLPASNSYGTLTDYEYLLPIGWQLNSVTSNGSTWLSTNNSNNVTVTSDLSHGVGGFVQIRASNIACGNGLQQSAVLRQIPIDRPAPNFYITGDKDICSGSKTYTLLGLPAGATVNWTVPTQNQVSIPNPSNGTTVIVTRIGTASTSVILSATVTDCVTTYPAVTKEIFLGQPGFGASYFNGSTSGAVKFYDPNNPTTSINNVCSEYGAYYIDGSPWATDAVTWPVPSSLPYCPTLSWSQTTPKRVNFYFTGGTAYLQGTASNTCGSASQIFAFQSSNCLPIGTDPCAKSLADYKLFSISPNPASDKIKIGIVSKPAPPPPCAKVAPKNNTGLGYTFSIVNIYNKLGILEKSIKSGDVTSITIPTLSLTTGIYNVEIISGTYNEKQQIIIQK